MDASIFVGMPWTDVSRAGMSVQVVARDAAYLEMAQEQATLLAEDIWDQRRNLQFDVETATIDEAIQMALESQDSTVFITDSGDNITAGAAGDVFGALDNYYIANYWGEADYTKYGSIPGAMQYTPKTSIQLDADLKTLPTDKTVVVYCWTGQTSANMAVYLRTIGYDAKTLKFGANGMIYDDLESHKWSEGAIFGYDYVGMPAPAK